MSGHNICTDGEIRKLSKNYYQKLILILELSVCQTKKQGKSSENNSLGTA